jgi:hypothetical protein
MFGIAAFSEVPFSSLPTSGGIWQEVRGDSNNWTRVDLNIADPIPSLSLNFVTGSYEVVDTLFEYDSLWKSASSGSNTWVVR